jgi:hypothetical protein
MREMRENKGKAGLENLFCKAVYQKLVYCKGFFASFFPKERRKIEKIFITSPINE